MTIMTVKNAHIKVEKLIKGFDFLISVIETLNCLANVCKLELACCWNGRNVSPKKPYTNYYSIRTRKLSAS